MTSQSESERERREQEAEEEGALSQRRGVPPSAARSSSARNKLVIFSAPYLNQMNEDLSQLYERFSLLLIIICYTLFE